MAKAIKCDRCGKCFDPCHMEGLMCTFRNPFFRSSEDMWHTTVARYMYDDADGYVDLCPDCAEMFEAFMSGCDIPQKINPDIYVHRTPSVSDWLKDNPVTNLKETFEKLFDDFEDDMKGKKDE